MDTIVLPFGYEAPRIIEDGHWVLGPIMLKRAEAANANSGKRECEDFLAHHGEIPTELRMKVAFVFTGWRNPDDLGSVAVVYWYEGRWVQGWFWFDHGCVWDGHYRPVRRSA